jgi:hypothetical protein
MSRTRKIFFKDGSTVTIVDGVVTEGTLPPEEKPAGPYILPDINAASGTFVSPIDGSVISSRSQLRAHNRRHGVDQIGNDYLFDQRKTDMLARYGRNPDGSFKVAKEHMDAIRMTWVDPGSE